MVVRIELISGCGDTADEEMLPECECECDPVVTLIRGCDCIQRTHAADLWVCLYSLIANVWCVPSWNLPTLCENVHCCLLANLDHWLPSYGCAPILDRVRLAIVCVLPVTPPMPWVCAPPLFVTALYVLVETVKV